MAEQEPLIYSWLCCGLQHDLRQNAFLSTCLLRSSLHSLPVLRGMDCHLQWARPAPSTVALWFHPEVSQAAELLVRSWMLLGFGCFRMQNFHLQTLAADASAGSFPVSSARVFVQGVGLSSFNVRLFGAPRASPISPPCSMQECRALASLPPPNRLIIN